MIGSDSRPYRRYLQAAILLSSSFGLLLTGCGGGSASSSNNAPQFTSPSSVRVDENRKAVMTLRAMDDDGDTLTYGIAGADVASFDVDPQSGEVTFIEAPDYESRSTYAFTANVSDGKSAASMDVNVTIEDSYFMDLARLQAEDAEIYDDFGNAVAMDGEYVVIGANDEDSVTDGSGSAYVFKIGSDGAMTQVEKLYALNIESDDAFGDAVAIDSAYIVVGAAHEDDTLADTGSAYVYKIGAGDTVTQIARLHASDAQEHDAFGASVAIDGDYIVVGAPKVDTTAEDAGSVYLFKRVSDGEFVQLSKFQADDIGIYDLFGLHVAIDAGHIIVGSHLEDTSANGAGSAYLFEIGDGDVVTQMAKLQADVPQQAAHFGEAVAIHGSYILVSAPEMDLAHTDAGSVYLYKLQEAGPVEMIATLQADTPAEDDHFGISLAMNGDYIVIGSRLEDTTAMDSGTAYVFSRVSDTQIVQKDKLVAYDAAQGDEFGASVAISGQYLVVTAPYDDTVATNTGSAYLYVKDPDEV
jgi:hypothetical protein